MAESFLILLIVLSLDKGFFSSCFCVIFYLMLIIVYRRIGEIEMILFFC